MSWNEWSLLLFTDWQRERANGGRDERLVLIAAACLLSTDGFPLIVMCDMQEPIALWDRNTLPSAGFRHTEVLMKGLTHIHWSSRFEASIVLVRNPELSLKEVQHLHLYYIRKQLWNQNSYLGSSPNPDASTPLLLVLTIYNSSLILFYLVCKSFE